MSSHRNDGKQSCTQAEPVVEAIQRLPKPLLEFHYSPLDPSIDGIRLVILDPSSALRAPIKCRLKHVTFAQKPKYEALSYMWGDGFKKITIYIHGKGFRVGLNLRSALEYLRDPIEERILWIDAISIKQADIPERNNQLRLMPNIYERAKVVLVWLGEKPLFGYLNLMHGSIWAEKHLSKLPQPRLVSELTWLEEMCDNQYWHRLWIIQEISKARNIEVYAEDTQRIGCNSLENSKPTQSFQNQCH